VTGDGTDVGADASVSTAQSAEESRKEIASVENSFKETTSEKVLEELIDVKRKNNPKIMLEQSG
jgi:hypothetical protein